jgi:hypothetical protein
MGIEGANGITVIDLKTLRSPATSTPALAPTAWLGRPASSGCWRTITRAAVRFVSCCTGNASHKITFQHPGTGAERALKLRPSDFIQKSNDNFCRKFHFTASRFAMMMEQILRSSSLSNQKHYGPD